MNATVEVFDAETCPECGRAKRLQRYGFRSGKQRYLYVCNPCSRLRRKASDPAAFLARRREVWKRYVSRPGVTEKIQARNKVKHLCRVGKVKRLPCEGCGNPETHAHHVDYSRPLDVRWLCSACHALEHLRA